MYQSLFIFQDKCYTNQQTSELGKNRRKRVTGPTEPPYPWYNSTYLLVLISLCPLPVYLAATASLPPANKPATLPCFSDKPPPLSPARGRAAPATGTGAGIPPFPLSHSWQKDIRTKYARMTQ
jgi:hypothetical protein